MDSAPEVYFRYALVPVRRMTYVSASARELTGHSRDTFYAEPWLCRSIVAPADRHQLRQLARARRSATGTLRLQRRDGSTVDVHVRTAPVIRARRLVAIEGVVTVLQSVRTSTSALDGAMPEPAQQRLAALLYEVHGLLHRHGVPARATAGAPAAESTLHIGDIALDVERMTVTMAGKRVELTSRELLLLRYLAQRRGRVVTRQQLLQDVWGYRYGGDDRTVDVHVSRVRRKLPPLRAFLRAVKHVGYCLDAAEAPAVNTGTSRRIANS